MNWEYMSGRNRGNGQREILLSFNKTREANRGRQTGIIKEIQVKGVSSDRRRDTEMRKCRREVVGGDQ
jgi:hypothetical protein